MPLLPEWLLALVLTLIVLDVFVQTEVLSWLAMLCFSTYVTWRLSPSPLWAVLTFILTFCVTTVLYYCFLRKVIRKSLNCTVMRNQTNDILERLPGQTGTIHVVDGKVLVMLNGELWSIDDGNSSDYEEGDSVAVISVHDGTLKIQKA